MLGYASHSVDSHWIYSTLKECKNREMSVAFAYSQGELSPSLREGFKEAGITVYDDADSGLMQKANAPLVLTASSGLPESFFSRQHCKWRVHMPHSFSSLHMIYPENAFDGYNVLFAVGPHHIKEFQKLSELHSLDHRQAFPCGYDKTGIYKTDYQYNADEKKHVLLAPSWGKGNILEKIGIELIEAMLDQGYVVTLRPHPAFFIESNPFLTKLKPLLSSEFRIEDSREASEALSSADLIISDYSGIVQEFFYMAPRPTLFVDVEKKEMNPHWRSVEITPLELNCRGKMGPIVEADTKDIIRNVERVFEHREQWMESAQDFETEYLFKTDCAVSSATHIENLLREKGV